MLARELVNRYFVTVRPTDSVQQAVDAMTKKQVGVVSVCDESGVPLGVLTDRDIVTRACSKRLSLQEASAASIMTREPLTCHVDDEMHEVEAAMTKRSVARVLAVDDEGRMVGIISLAEIWHHESPLRAGSLSRRISERELRIAATGGHYNSGRATED